MNYRGFTLIELLVVISIVGMLSSVVLSSLNTSRGKARDSVRVQTLKQMQRAIETYYIDNGAYPPAVDPADWNGGSAACVGAWFTASADWIPGLVSGGYISSLPTDPQQSGCNQYMYLTNTNRDGYKLLANGLASRLYTFGEPMARCPAGCTT